MHKEISMAVDLGVSMIALAAIIGIIWFSVIMGKDVATSASMEASEILYASQVATLEDLYQNGETEMPIAAAYNILRTYGSYIPRFYCYKCKSSSEIDKNAQDLTKRIPCVLNHLDCGRIFFYIDKDDSGLYYVCIRPYDDEVPDGDNYYKRFREDLGSLTE